MQFMYPQRPFFQKVLVPNFYYVYAFLNLKLHDLVTGAFGTGKILTWVLNADERSSVFRQLTINPVRYLNQAWINFSPKKKNKN